MRGKISLYKGIHIFIAIFFFGIKLVPQFQYAFAGTFWSLMYQGIFGIWLVISILRSGFWFRYLKKYIRYWFLWLLYLTFVFMIFPNTQIGFFSLNLTFWEPMFLYYYYTEILDYGRKESAIIAFVCVAFLLLGLIQSIQSINVNELAAREASSGHSSDDAMLTGNYSFTATLTILLPVCYSMLISNLQNKWKFTAFTIIGLTFYFVIHCNLMISILCLFFTLPVFFIMDNNSKFSIKRILIVCFFSVILLLLLPFLKQGVIYLLQLFAKVINSKEIDNKVIQLISLLNGMAIGNVESRFGLVDIALNTFINHPIIGIGPQNNANIYFKTYLGMHSTFFDDLARYGVLGMGVMLGAYISFYRDKIKMYSGTCCIRALKTSLISYVVISMLNPTISANVGITLFFVIPSLLNEILEIQLEKAEVERYEKNSTH
ncbi:MAG TPA: hypothetical protein K8V91_05285 [[Clostridium] spiroforme]|uniref:O-antigen ligase-related domain-containing protein n=1 Tax=Thomasclavelia spiroformis TaxID=29348 RepID=A0A921GBM7_9FIRM|nr:hypothetical protein [Thomasclavelia spiroformis]